LRLESLSVRFDDLTGPDTFLASDDDEEAGDMTST
jgi:hypothetical protein